MCSPTSRPVPPDSAVRNRLFASLALAFAALSSGTCPAACVENFTSFRLDGYRNGVFFEFHVPLNWSKHYPDTGNGQHTGCTTAMFNCNGLDYAYQLVPDAGNFQISLEDVPGLGDITATRADVIAFYDYYFTADDGYNRHGGDLVFSKNCHGHSFGVNCWPFADGSGVGRLAACYEQVDEQLTHILLHEQLAHSFKAHEISLCGGGEGESGYYIISEATEKANISPIYTRDGGGCWGGIGNIDTSAIFPHLYYKLRPIP